MNSLPKISVVIPSYNKAEFIEKTLDSIIMQKYNNFEVIIQDGSSVDGTLEIIKRYAIKYPKIIFWKSEKDNGQVDAINRGMKRASGDILTYINADDVYFAGVLTRVSDYFLKNKESLWVVGRGKIINTQGLEISRWVTSYKNLLLDINLYSLLLMVNYITQPSVFFTKKAYQKYGPFKGTNEYVLEYDFWLRLGKVSMPGVITKSLSCFRMSGHNISAVSYGALLLDDYKLVKKYTTNAVILFLHRIHNWGRVVTVNLLKK